MITTTPDGAFHLPPKAQYTRKVAKGPRHHFTGQLVLGSQSAPVISDVESHTEMMVAMVLMTRPNVVHVENQVPFRWQEAPGKDRTHYFDFRALLKDGTRIAVAVKAAHRLQSDRLMRELADIARRVTPDFADRVVVMTERDIDAITSHNAELLYAARLPEPDVDAAARRAVRDLSATARIADLIDEIGHGGQGFWAVVRLLRSGELQLVRRERICHDALVMKGGV